MIDVRCKIDLMRLLVGVALAVLLAAGQWLLSKKRRVNARLAYSGFLDVVARAA